MALKKKTQKHSGPVTYSLKTPLFANAQQALHEVKSRPHIQKKRQKRWTYIRLNQVKSTTEHPLTNPMFFNNNHQQKEPPLTCHKATTYLLNLLFPHCPCINPIK